MRAGIPAWDQRLPRPIGDRKHDVGAATGKPVERVRGPGPELDRQRAPLRPCADAPRRPRQEQGQQLLLFEVHEQDVERLFTAKAPRVADGPDRESAAAPRDTSTGRA